LVECNSKNCPVHGNLRTRGTVFEGRVVSAKSKNTAVIEISRQHKVRKYERLEKRRSKIHVHVQIGRAHV
jgi:small subunit ribosomal protein S17